MLGLGFRVLNPTNIQSSLTFRAPLNSERRPSPESWPETGERREEASAWYGGPCKVHIHLCVCI